MGTYDELDQPFLGRPAYVQQQANGQKNYVYWLPLHVQWVIGSPLGYNIDPWMYVSIAVYIAESAAVSAAL
jgi:hypothetical protein